MDEDEPVEVAVIEDDPEIVQEEGEGNVAIDDDHFETTTITDDSVTVVVEAPPVAPVSTCCEHCAGHESRLASLETVEEEIAQEEPPVEEEVDVIAVEEPKVEDELSAEEKPGEPTEEEKPKKKTGSRKMMRR